jgi:hypothetical protein
MNLDAASEFVQATAATAAAGRLVYLGLERRFPALLAYLIFTVVSTVCYSLFSTTSRLYFWIYILLLPLDSIFSIFAVRELLMLTFDNYPGIRTIGRWAMYAGTGLSVAVSLVLTRVFWAVGASGRQKWGLFYFEVAQRSIVFSLAVVIIAIIFVLSKYPLHLGRNTYVSCAFFSALFLSEAIELFVDALTRELFNRYADWTADFVIAFCLVGWAALLRPQTAAVARVAFADPQEDHLLQQLDSLNQLMSRAARQ